MNKDRWIKNVFLWGACILALLGSAVIVYSTANGLSGFSDSVEYLVVARNIIHGVGMGYYFPGGRFYHPTIYPPFYMIALASGAIFKLDPLQTARLFDILFLATEVILLGYLFHRFSTISSFSLLAGLLFCVFSSIIWLYFSVMSEPLYFLLFLGSVICLLVYLQNQLNRWLILSAILVGLSIITRYDGIPTVLVGLLSIFLFDRGKFGQRLKKALLFGFLASLPLLVFGISIHFNLEQPSLVSNVSSLSSLLITFQTYRASVLNLVWGWIPFQAAIPIQTSRARSFFLILFLVGVTVLTLFSVKRIMDRQMTPAAEQGDFLIFMIFGLSAALSYIFLAFTFITFGLPARMDDRQLLPLYISTVLSLLGAVACWQKAWLTHRQWAQVFPWLIAGVFIYSSFPGTAAVITQAHAGGGSLAPTWKDSDLIEAVQALPQKTLIISNRPDVLLLWADRPAYDFLSSLHPNFIDQKTIYGSDPSDEAQIAFREQGALLVIFDHNIPQEIANVYGENGRERGKTIFNGLVVDKPYSDGTIYFYPGPAHPGN